MRESVLSATQLGTYTLNLHQNRKLPRAILHVSTVTLANWPHSYRAWSAYAASDTVMTLMSQCKIY